MKLLSLKKIFFCCSLSIFYLFVSSDLFSQETLPVLKEGKVGELELTINTQTRLELAIERDGLYLLENVFHHQTPVAFFVYRQRDAAFIGSNYHTRRANYAPLIEELTLLAHETYYIIINPLQANKKPLRLHLKFQQALQKQDDPSEKKTTPQAAEEKKGPISIQELPALPLRGETVKKLRLSHFGSHLVLAFINQENDFKLFFHDLRKKTWSLLPQALEKDLKIFDFDIGFDNQGLLYLAYTSHPSQKEGHLGFLSIKNFNGQIWTDITPKLHEASEGPLSLDIEGDRVWLAYHKYHVSGKLSEILVMHKAPQDHSWQYLPRLKENTLEPHIQEMILQARGEIQLFYTVQENNYVYATQKKLLKGRWQTQAHTRVIDTSGLAFRTTPSLSVLAQTNAKGHPILSQTDLTMMNRLITPPLGERSFTKTALGFLKDQIFLLLNSPTETLFLILRPEGWVSLQPGLQSHQKWLALENPAGSNRIFIAYQEGQEIRIMSLSP